MESQYAKKSSKVKTTVLFEKKLLDEIDQFNPFQTRKEFLDQACKIYLGELRKRLIDEQLAQACSEAGYEDTSVNEDWELVALEGWQ